MRTFLFLFVGLFFGGMTQAAEYRSEERYGFRVIVPGRWGQTVPSTDGTIAVLRLEAPDASCYMLATFPKNPGIAKYSTLREWAETGHIPGFIKGFAGGSYKVENSREGRVKLGSGVEATFILQDLSYGLLNRSVIFLFWETKIQGNEVWHYARCSSKKDIKLAPDTEPMLELLSGIKAF